MKIKSFVLTAVLATAVLTFTATSAGAMTSSEIDAMIAQIQAQIQALLQQIAALQAQQTSPQAWCHTFNFNLGIGDMGDEVAALHTALTKEGFTSTSWRADNFTEITASKVSEFQEKYVSEILAPYGLTHGTGYVGKTTRAKLNALYGCGITTQPSITVLSPNGGEMWKIGETYNINWTYSGTFNPTITITLMDYNNSAIPATAATIVGSYSVSNNSYSWNIPSSIIPGSRYKIGVGTVEHGFNNSVVAQDYSDNYFSIVSSTTNCAQNGEMVYTSASFGPAVCCSQNAGIKPSSFLSGDLCIMSMGVSKGICVENWGVTCGNGVCGTGEDKCNCAKDCSTEPSITVTSPNGGEVWRTGGSFTVKWSSRGLSSTDKVYLKLVKYDNENPISCNLTDGPVNNTGQYSAVLSPYFCSVYGGVLGNKIKLKITKAVTSVEEKEMSDESDNYFSIVSSTSCTNLLGQDSCLNNSACYWDQQYNNCRNYDSTKQLCSDPDSGIDFYTQAHTFGFRKYAANERDARIRTGGKDACISSTQLIEHYCIDGYYIGTYYQNCPNGCENGACKQSTQPSITVTTANTWTQWEPTKTYPITWTSVGINSVNIELVKGTESWLIATNVAGFVGSPYNWTVPSNFPMGNDYRIHIWANTSPVSAEDYSDSTISIVALSQEPSITVISPNGGESLKVGGVYRISWSGTGNSSGSQFIQLIQDMKESYTSCAFTIAVINDTQTISGSYTWTIPSSYTSAYCGTVSLAGNQFKIKVSDGQISDSSDNYFSIVSATSTLQGSLLDEIQRQLSSIADAVAKMLGQ